MALLNKLPTRQLGRNGPELPRLGLGLMNASSPVYGAVAPEATRLAFLDEAYKRGEIFWDTADEYGNSEEVIGKWFAANPEKRKDIFLATKFGVKMNRNKVEGKPRGFGVDSSPEYCKEAIEKSLERLGLDYVDLFYCHRLDKKTPIERTISAMVELKNAGKIKYLGLSECSADSLWRAHAVHPITCVQVEYSAFCIDIESPNTRLLETARDLGVAIVAYSPLGNGFLTGMIRTREDVTKDGDFRYVLPWLSEDNIEKNIAIVDKIAEIAKRRGISTAQLALAWLLAQGDDIFAIPGTTKIHRLDENLTSLSISLSKEDERSIRELSQEVVGGRFQTTSGYAFADTPEL